MGFFRDFWNYLGELFTGFWQKVFMILDILGILLFFSPEFSNALTTNESLIRIIGGAIFIIPFILANFSLYRRYLEHNSIIANIRLDVIQQEFGHPYGTRNPFRDIPPSSQGFKANGMPDWVVLWAKIRIINIGREGGQLIMNFDNVKYKLPHIFNLSDVKFTFLQPLRINGQTDTWQELYIDILFNDIEPQMFAEELRVLVNSNKRYRVEIPYKTGLIGFESKPRKLVLEGDFSYLHEKVLERWEGYGFPQLAKIARGN